MKILFLMMAMTSTAVYAVEESNKSIDQKLASLKLEKMQAVVMISTMVKRGHMKTEDAARIKREIASAKDQDFEDIKAEAIEKLDSKNSFATK